MATLYQCPLFKLVANDESGAISFDGCDFGYEVNRGANLGPLDCRQYYSQGRGAGMRLHAFPSRIIVVSSRGAVRYTPELISWHVANIRRASVITIAGRFDSFR